jgi:hypothetical protein
MKPFHRIANGPQRSGCGRIGSPAGVFQHRLRLKRITPTGPFALRSINPLIGPCGLIVIKPLDSEKFSKMSGLTPPG